MMILLGRFVPSQAWLDAVIKASPTLQQNFTIVDQID